MFSEKFKIWFLSNLIFVFYRTLMWTWKLKVEEHPQLLEDIKNNTAAVFAHWHEDINGIIAFAPKYKVASIASVSKDGEYITRLLNKLGMKMARGSSSKKGVKGLRELLRLAKENYIMSIPVDGPRGPRHVPKPGVFEVSKLLNARIYPGRIACSSVFTLKKSWDQSIIPMPFSTIYLVWSEPMTALTKEDDPRDEKFKLELQKRLFSTGHLASEGLKRCIKS